MASELNAMEMNNTWSITTLPKGKHFIGYRWVYKIKYNQMVAERDIRLFWLQRGTLNKKGWILLISSTLLLNSSLLKSFEPLQP